MKEGVAMSVLFRIHAGEKEAVIREIASWNATPNEPDSAREVDGLIEEVLAERDRDEALLKRVLQRARGADRQKLDEAHRFIQEYTRRSIHIHNLLRELIQRMRQAGHPVEAAAALDRATHDYERWQEDYPELLLMAGEPVGEVIRGRIARALASAPTESNWRELFADDPPAEGE
jgi:hypothetical protein